MTGDRNGDGVEGRVMHQAMAQCLQPQCQSSGQTGNALGHGTQAVRAMVDRVHAGDHGRQHLGGADVGSGFFAADVLLTGLQCQSQSRCTFCIQADAHQPSGQ